MKHASPLSQKSDPFLGRSIFFPLAEASFWLGNRRHGWNQLGLTATKPETFQQVQLPVFSVTERSLCGDPQPWVGTQDLWGSADQISRQPKRYNFLAYLTSHCGCAPISLAVLLTLLYRSETLERLWNERHIEDLTVFLSDTWSDQYRRHFHVYVPHRLLGH